MSATFYVSAAARTQVFTPGSLPTLPAQVTSRRERQTVSHRRMIRCSPILMYFVVITLLWAVFMKALISPATLRAEQLRISAEQRMQCAVDYAPTGMPVP